MKYLTHFPLSLLQADIFSYGIILCEMIARITSDPEDLPRLAVRNSFYVKGGFPYLSCIIFSLSAGSILILEIHFVNVHLTFPHLTCTFLLQEYVCDTWAEAAMQHYNRLYAFNQSEQGNN